MTSFVSPLCSLQTPQNPSAGKNFLSPEEGRFRMVIYTPCSAPPPLFCINFLSWWGDQTQETAAKGEAAEVEGGRTAAPRARSVCQGMEDAARPGPGPRETGFSLGLELRTCKKPEAAGCPRRARSTTSGSQHPASAPSEIACPACPSPELVDLGLAASRPRPPTGAQGHTAGPRLSAASASSRSMGSGPQPSLPSPGGGGKGRR